MVGHIGHRKPKKRAVMAVHQRGKSRFIPLAEPFEQPDFFRDGAPRLAHPEQFLLNTYTGLVCNRGRDLSHGLPPGSNSPCMKDGAFSTLTCPPGRLRTISAPRSSM